MGEIETEDQARRRTIPLALALLAIVGALVAVISGVVIGENYRRGLGVATDMGQRLFENLRADIAVQQRQMVHPIEFAVAVLAEYTTLGAGKAENLEGSFVTILEANPQVTEVRVGYATGEFFAVVQLSGSEGSLRTAAGAPPEAVYATRRIACGAGGAWMMTWSYIGADRKAIGTRSAPVPEPGHQAESWYAAATAAPGTIIQTKASVISGQRAIGMSFARSFTGPSRGVIAAEISLAQLSKVLI